MDNELDFEKLLAQMLVDDAPRPAHQNELRQRVLSAFDEAHEAPVAGRVTQLLISKGKRIMTHPMSRWTIGCTAAVVLVAWLFAPWDTSSKAFAGLLDPMLNAKTARFKITSKPEGMPMQQFNGYFLAPNRIRQEMNGAVTISDFSRGMMTTLVAAEKRAMIFETKGGDAQDSRNFFSNLRQVLKEQRGKNEAELKDLGQKDLAGRRVFGFRVDSAFQSVTLWGDVETGRLVQLEATLPGPPKTEVVMTDMEFDVELNESLFDATPPADYQVTRLDIDTSPPTEKDFLEALRACLKFTGGEFLSSFDGAAMGAMFAKSIAKDNKAPTEEQIAVLMKQSIAIGRGLTFAMKQPEAHYAGKGIQESDPKTPVYWYKPAGGTTYRIIHNDLSITDASTAPISPNAVKLRAATE